MIIGIKPDRIAAYEALHAASNPGVRDLLDKYHMHNFSIYIHKMDDSHYYLFAYYEYTGNDYQGDMATLAREPRNIEWLSQTDAMQIPFPGEHPGRRCRRFTTIHNEGLTAGLKNTFYAATTLHGSIAFPFVIPTGAYPDFLPRCTRRRNVCAFPQRKAHEVRRSRQPPQEIRGSVVEGPAVLSNLAQCPHGSTTGTLTG